MNDNGKGIGNRFGEEGVKTLSESLRVNTSLTTLYLGGDDKNQKKK